MSESDSGQIEERNVDDVFELCFPSCDDKLIPVVGSTFPSIDDGVNFYESYAFACGFITRKSTVVTKDKTVVTRYVLCNRQGLNDTPTTEAIMSKLPPKRKRKTVSCRVDCMARIVFQFEAGVGYRVSTFNEGHTHPMVPQPYRHLMKSNRNVNLVHQMFVLSGIKANVGPMKTFRFYKELVGGYDAVGATSIDFKNYSRDLRAFVVGVDAQVMLDNLKFKKENCSGFNYSFDVDEEKKLSRLFWSDEQSIKNYNLFGDIVSFDATYSTNRYKMIFTPFTGRDNHGGCVTFGAAIISHEDVDAYSWVLQRFVDCMGKHPKLLITDQDPALKKVVPIVMPNTYHRFCLWHITKKVPDKITASLREDPDFKTTFDGLIWSESDEPAEFEKKWHEIMLRYGLHDNKWFCDMFELRKLWIPAYFRDISLGCLFRTTSLSESENSFFKRYLNKDANLIRFDMHYNSAMDSQRSSYNALTLADETGVPAMATELAMERHAAKVYTNKKFREVQVEIVEAVMKCVLSRMYFEGVLKLYDVDDGSGTIFKVSHDVAAEDMVCTCKMFSRKGILCRHILYVMRNDKLQRIPDKYILRRWSKLSVSVPFTSEQSEVSNPDKVVVGNTQFFAELCKSIASVDKDVELQKLLLSDLVGLSEKFAALGVQPDYAISKQSLFQQFHGSKISDTIDVGTPDVVLTKGCGVGGRKKSMKEIAIEAAKKKLRNCRSCKRLVDHDSRNCPKNRDK